MKDNVTLRIPESVDSPLYRAFISLYYEYLDQVSKSTAKNYVSELDIDISMEAYVSKFLDTYAKYIPKDVKLDKRNFVKLLNAIYQAKGTEKAISIIFKILFGVPVTYSTPGDRILRASDGQWIIEKFVTLTTIYGSVNSATNTINFSNASGNFEIHSTHYDIIGSNKIRFYYQTFSKIVIDDNQKFYINSSTPTPQYAGVISQSQSGIVVLSGGSDWQKGQVLVIPGTVKDTVARITKVATGTGAILECEVLDFGFDHQTNQTTVVSPYNNKPIDSVIDINSTLISVGPNVYHHVLNITDYTDGCFETIVGSYSGPSTQNLSTEAFSYTSVQSYSASSVSNSEITIDQWLASRATLTFSLGKVVNTKGSYKTDSGQLSNQQIRLEDNYFYQLFSYLLESSIDISDFRSVLNIVHPGGLKMFASLEKLATFDVNAYSSRTISRNIIYLIDLVTEFAETRYLDFVKQLTDSAIATETLSKSAIKYLSGDSVTPTSPDTVTSQIVVYALEDYFAEAYVSIDNYLFLGY
jgi:hypothetical protein